MLPLMKTERQIMNSRDMEYYARRAQQERRHAERADDKIARRVHLEMAERYAAMVGDSAIVVPQLQV